MIIDVLSVMSLLQETKATMRAMTIEIAAGSHIAVWAASIARDSAKKNAGKIAGHEERKGVQPARGSAGGRRTDSSNPWADRYRLCVPPGVCPGRGRKSVCPSVGLDMGVNLHTFQRHSIEEPGRWPSAAEYDALATHSGEESVVCEPIHQ
jgi:hypothetical protein